jgi:putative phosphoesterase
VKIAIISDSHDNIINIKKAVNIANKNHCEYLLHLGDIVSPFSAKELGAFKGIVYAIFGNNDGEHQGLISAFNQFGGFINRAPYKIELNGKKIVLMHEPYLLDELITSKAFDYIFYGHLHEIDYRKIKNTVILNPGELGGWLSKSTFYILNLENEMFEK